MKISKNFKKVPWIRRVHPDNVSLAYARNYKPLPGRELKDYQFPLHVHKANLGPVREEGRKR